MTPILTHEQPIVGLEPDGKRRNPLWGAPKIHGELLNLGIDVAQSTVSVYMVLPLPALHQISACVLLRPLACTTCASADAFRKPRPLRRASRAVNGGVKTGQRGGVKPGQFASWA